MLLSNKFETIVWTKHSHCLSSLFSYIKPTRFTHTWKNLEKFRKSQNLFSCSYLSANVKSSSEPTTQGNHFRGNHFRGNLRNCIDFNTGFRTIQRKFRTFCFINLITTLPYYSYTPCMSKVDMNDA